ncbi:MAG: hypothetical protein AAFV54_06395 [Pseudomonadota bacterium]
MEIGKPTIRLLHKSPFSSNDESAIDLDKLKKVKLLNFRDRLTKAHIVQFWETPKELQLEAVYALMDAQKRFPAFGWIRGDQIPVDRQIFEESIKILESTTRFFGGSIMWAFEIAISSTIILIVFCLIQSFIPNILV